MLFSSRKHLCSGNPTPPTASAILCSTNASLQSLSTQPPLSWKGGCKPTHHFYTQQLLRSKIQPWALSAHLYVWQREWLQHVLKHVHVYFGVWGKYKHAEEASAARIFAIFLVMLLQVNHNLTSASQQRAHLWPHLMPLPLSLTWKHRLLHQHRPRVSNQKGLNMSLHKPGKLHNKSHKPTGGIKHARESGVK